MVSQPAELSGSTLALLPLQQEPSSFSGLGVDAVSGYGRSPREDRLAQGPPGISSLANPDGSKLCSDTAQPCHDQLLPGLWCWQKPSLVLPWDVAHRCIQRCCLALPNVPKRITKAAEATQAKHQRGQREDFSGCMLIEKPGFDLCKARKCRCGVRAWIRRQEFSLRSNSCYVAIILGNFQGT